MKSIRLRKLLNAAIPIGECIAGDTFVINNDRDCECLWVVLKKKTATVKARLLLQCSPRCAMLPYLGDYKSVRMVRGRKIDHEFTMDWHTVFRGENLPETAGWASCTRFGRSCRSTRRSSTPTAGSIRRDPCRKGSITTCGLGRPRGNRTRRGGAIIISGGFSIIRGGA